MPGRPRPFAAVFAVSFALLVHEIMLSAIFNVLIGAGNTVAAIAVALVGLSAGGICAYLVPVFHDRERAERWTGALLFWFGVTLMLCSLAVVNVPLSHGDLIYYRDDPFVRLWSAAVYQIATLPFFLGGITISVFLRSYAGRIGRLYFSDLGGAALGCLASPFLLAGVGAPRAILYAALPAALLGAGLGFRGRRAGALLALPLGIVALDALVPGLHGFAKLNTMGTVREPAYRSFEIEPGDIEFEKWALDAWTILRSESIPDQWERFEGWGLSPRYDGPVPRTRFINYNARFSTYVTEFDGDFGPIGEWLDADLTSLHFLLGRRFESVLNIGGGGGREVLNALHHGAERVVMVDVSEVAVEDVMKGRLSEFSGRLYFDPRVEAVADEGRTFAERSRERFDLIDFSIVGGINLEKMDLVRVDDLFTLEALRTYLSRLRDGGVFSYVMYSTRADLVAELAGGEVLTTQPYIPALRTLTGLRTALAERDPDARFADHVLIASLSGLISPHYDLVHIIASPSPFTPGERRRFLERCEALGFTAVHPRAGPESGGFEPYAAVIGADDVAALAASLPFSILPATDDRPFQYALDARHLRKALRDGALLRVLSGNPLLSLGASIGLVAAALMLIPAAVVWARRGERASKLRAAWPLLVYFACIGFGYMAIEISVLLRLQSYLGKPIYGLAVGLFSFLLASGLGSALTGRFGGAALPRRVYAIVALLGCAGLGFYALSEPLFAATIGLPLAPRIGIAVAAAFPMAFPMGMLFPIGIRLLSREDESLIPWAWGINGCMSVLGILGTRILSLFAGFGGALLAGLVVYVLVAACVAGQARRRAGAG